MSTKRRKPDPKRRRRPQLTAGQLATLLTAIAAILQALAYLIHGR